MKKVQHEAMEQEKLFRWAFYMSAKYPDLAFLHHIPNGGSRNKIEAFNLKKQGVKAGVPDVCLPVPSGEYHGLYIEMKYDRNKPTENQCKWLAFLSSKRYAVKVCYDWQSAAESICRYLNIPFN